MEAVLFFWFGWMLWAVVTFFMKEGRLRFYLAALVLTTLITMPQVIRGENWEFPVAFVLLMIGACIWTGLHSLRRCAHIVLIGLALMLLYASIQLMFWYNPVVFLIDDVWIPAIVLAFFVLFLHRRPLSRYPVAMLAFCFGEVLSAIILSPLTSGIYIADTNFFNQLAAVLVLLCAWQSMEGIALRLAYFSLKKSRTPRHFSL